MDAQTWAALLDGADVVQVATEVRTPHGEIRRVVADLVADRDPVCQRCGTRCGRCASALPASYDVIERDDAPHVAEYRARLALRQLEPEGTTPGNRRPRRIGGRA